jgi:hypothetical protein
MKQMEYGNGKNEILFCGTYKGKDFVIVNLHGNHPCAYVHSNIDFYHSDEECSSPAHCGFTFYGKLTHWKKYDEENYNEEFFNRYFVGWDYGHIGDYMPFLEDGKKWTTEEIFDNIKQVIDWIKIKERK